MCSTPLTIRRHEGEEWKISDQYVTTRRVPCGKCVKCLKRRQAGWVFRLSEQLKVAETAAFFTLTYGENQNPSTGKLYGNNPPQTENGNDTLCKKDIQKFFKRLRKRTGLKNIKYFLTGEYGPTTFRPHYHAIIYNVPTYWIQRSHLFAEKIWTHGKVDIKPCNVATMTYTVSYFFKGGFKPLDDSDDRQPNIQMQSQGLGINYIDRMEEFHQDRLDSTVTHPNGYLMAMPRYYRDRIFSDEQKYELNRIAALVNEISWDDFANIDYKKQIEKIEMEDYQLQRKLELERNSI